MQATPYLMFNGQCEAAFQFYAQTLGGRLMAMTTYGETPAAEHTSPALRDQIIHARLRVGDTVLMGSDCPPEFYEPTQGMSVSLQVDSPAEAERVFNALAEGGTVRMAMAETFFAVRFGTVTDRFGTPWMIVCEKAG